MNRDQIVEIIEKMHKNALADYEIYVKNGEANNWDEDYEDTLERKYSEGFADAFSVLLGTISAKEKREASK